MNTQDSEIRERQQWEYHLLHHDEEVARLSAQHQVLRQSMGKLAFAPVDWTKNGLKILDSATADGQWLRDLRETLSSEDNEYIGTDSIAKHFPPLPLPGVSMIVQRMDEPWPEDWNRTFDYVHQRFVVPACEKLSPEAATKNMCRLLKPGGWIELVENDHNSPNAGGFWAGEELFRQIFKVAGLDVAYPYRMKDWLKAAGMEDVREEVFKVPIGILNPVPDMAVKSTWSICSALRGLLPMARALSLDMSRAEIDNIPQHTEDQLNRVGGELTIVVTYGRRPTSSS